MDNIIRNNILPFGQYKAIWLFGFIFVKAKKNENISRTTIDHEKIHGRQYLEVTLLLSPIIIFLSFYWIYSLLFIPFIFYIWYIVEWLFKGYRGISFEREAYKYQNNIESRKFFGWLKLVINF